MTREQMNAKLDRKDIAGIGVECVYDNGCTVYYSYEDFNGPADGIDRAMKQLYPLLHKGDNCKADLYRASTLTTTPAPEVTRAEGEYRMVKVDHITKENGRWFAELEVDGKLIHTGNIYGWEGLHFKDLRQILVDVYGIPVPDRIGELTLWKKTTSRHIYVLVNEEENIK